MAKQGVYLQPIFLLAPSYLAKSVLPTQCCLLKRAHGTSIPGRQTLIWMGWASVLPFSRMVKQGISLHPICLLAPSYLSRSMLPLEEGPSNNAYLEGRP
jgi:hypothetical protein